MTTLAVGILVVANIALWAAERFRKRRERRARDTLMSGVIRRAR